MRKNIEVHGFANRPKRSLRLSLLAAGVLLLACLGGSAQAAPVGKDGQIHACYRVKGKPRGLLRVVRSARAHCRRGERKVSWSVASTSGPSGQNGQDGEGQAGPSGVGASSATTSKEAALQTQIAGLTLKVEKLEGLLGGISSGQLSALPSRVSGLEDVLEGVGNESLTNALDAVQGLSNSELTEAVGLAPVVETLCAQNEELAEQINLISGVVKGLGLSSGLEALGLLVIPTLPADLPSLGCE